MKNDSACSTRPCISSFLAFIEKEGLAERPMPSQSRAYTDVRRLAAQEPSAGRLLKKKPKPAPYPCNRTAGGGGGGCEVEELDMACVDVMDRVLR